MPKCKVILGSVRTDRGEVKCGSYVELTEKDTKLMIENKVVELAIEPQQPSQSDTKPKDEPKKQPKAKPKKKDETKVEVVPSIDWTRPELEEVANSKGIKEPEKFANKKDLLNAIEGRSEPKVDEPQDEGIETGDEPEVKDQKEGSDEPQDESKQEGGEDSDKTNKEN